MTLSANIGLGNGLLPNNAYSEKTSSKLLLPEDNEILFLQSAPTWTNQLQNVGMKFLIHSQTVQPLKFWNGQVILLHTLLGTWLLIQHSRLLPICDAFFYSTWPPSFSSHIKKEVFLIGEESDDGHRIKRALYIGIKRLSNRGGERRWPQNKTALYIGIKRLCYPAWDWG